MTRLDAAPGALAPVDLQLAALVRRRAAETHDERDAEILALTAALLSAERARGHSCIELSGGDGERSPRALADALGVASVPDAETWRGALERSPLCGDGNAPTPLVRDGARVYLYRYWTAERRLASGLRRMLDQPPPPPPSTATAKLFGQLFAPLDPTTVDRQAMAAVAALRGRLAIITGGPGTGKTTTVARILALLLGDRPGLRVALAAPTGKAAARLTESVRSALGALDIDDALRRRIPTAGRTLHRLLGYQPWTESFLHGPEQPLLEDVIVVDEASMVDLLLMDALFAAVRPDARVILLGDPDQLASVDTGYVLGDLCAAAARAGDACSASFAAEFEALSGQCVPAAAAAPPLRDAVVRLVRSYRFEARPGIGALAEAVRRGDGGAALAALDDPAHDEVRLHAHPDSLDALLVPVVPQLDAYLAAASPEEALERLAEFRILCAVREGAWGVEGLNRAVERWLRRRGHSVRERWYDRRPVLVTANHYGSGLFNGDVGLCFRRAGSTLVYFPDSSGSVRGITPARLPECDTAWAMTVHKSQGSEFDRVLLVLPDHDTRVLGRELLYTGVTRARRAVDVVASAAMIDRIVRRVTARQGGLAESLTH